MIETGFRPATFTVAALAVVAERTIVNVIAGVTACAGTFSGAVFFTGRMTVRAGNTQVSCDQRKITEIMIENSAVNRHDIGAAPFVIGMAHNALTLLCRIKEAVKSRPFDPIASDVLVAVNT